MFKKKYEFKPDKERSGTLSKLYITKKQRLTLVKWFLMALLLTAISVVQEVILSRVHIFGAPTDLLACTILMVCILQDPEIGCIFVLISSTLYWFYGSAPGPYVILLLTGLGIVVSIFRHAFLRDSFASTMICTSVAVMVYELLIFAIGYFLGHITVLSLRSFCITGGVSLAVMPLIYPIVVSIGKIGGESWKE